MTYSHEVEHMCVVKKGPNHGPAPIPEEGKWVKSKEIKDISGLTHGIGWCAPQQGACKLTLNVKEGIIQEALVETIGCSGMTHSAAMAAEILPGKTVLEALNTDLVCDAINTAMRELFHILGNLCCDKFLHIHKLLFQFIKYLVLLIHCHKFFIIAVFFQVCTVFIINFLGSINQL